MGRPERALPSDDTPLTEFAGRLRAVRLSAGQPSYRRLAAVTHFSVATLARAAAGEALPSLEVTLAYVTACGGEAGQWRAAWEEVAAWAARSRSKNAETTGVPESGPTAAPSALRVPLTSLVGRDDLAARVVGLTDENRLVTLTGPGGVGKTRLAAEVAGRALARGRGAVWLADLVPLSDPGDVPYAVLAAAGIREGPRAGAADGEPGPAAEPGAPAGPDPVRRLLSGLRERSGLLVLDNCEHQIDAVARLADAVLSRCPGIRILITSREALGIFGETLCPVPPLPVPPASGAGGLAVITATASVRLLADRARAVRPGFTVTDANAAEVAGICRVLDGMPLAIELAAARLRTMSPAQLTGRLGDRFAVLTGGSRTALPRHRTLRAVVDWSWDLLSKPERTLARRLAVLPAGAALDAAEGICCDEPGALCGDLPAGAVLDALTRLADKSFLAVTQSDGDPEPRYRMLDTIRAYCLERLTESGEEDSVRDRMSRHYLALAERAEPLLRTRSQLRWLDVLAAETGNIHAALRWAISRGDADSALRFCAALCWYWYLCGQAGDGGALARAALALDAADPGREDRATAEARAICAMTVAMSADWDMAAAQETLDATDPGGRLGHPVIVVGRAAAARFSPDREHWLEVLAGHFGSADPWTGAAVRMMSAVILFGLGRIEEASLALDVALAAFREIGEIWGIGTCLMNRADLCKIAGDYRGAIAALEEAAVPGRQLGSSPDKDLTWLHCDLAWLRVRTGDYAAAHAALDLADQKARAWGDPGRYQRLIRAELAWREGHAGQAARLCADILRMEAGKPASQASLRALAGVRLGVLTLEAGDTASGTALLREALATAATSGDRLSTATAVEGLAVAALLTARTAGAARAAVLLGAADSIRGAVDHSSLDAPGVRAAARGQLGAAVFDAAYRRGRCLPYDEAFGFAQGEGCPETCADASARLPDREAGRRDPRVNP